MNKRLIITVLGLIISGCGGSGGSSDTGSVSGAGDAGTVSLSIADAPIDEAMQVMIEFTGVEFQHSSGQILEFNFDPPRQINVLALQSGNTAMLLDNEQLIAGHYNSVRLMINSGPGAMGSFIERPAGTFPLTIPDGHMNGLRITDGFDVPAGGSADFTIDFDLRRSIQCLERDTECLLKPALRMANNATAGNIEGRVSSMLVHNPACRGGIAVYVYEGMNITPTDVGPASNQGGPLATAMVVMDPGSGEYQYNVSHLEPGDYTVAFTCDGINDDPGTIDMIDFIGSTGVSVGTRMGMRHDF